MSSERKIRFPSELLYVLAIVLIAFSVAMVTCADLGVSMVVAPAYILSLRLSFLTFGQCEYIVQGIVFILFCFLMGRFRVRYLGSFLSCVIYGAVLDAWRKVVPLFNPDVTPPGSMPMPARIALLAVGMTLTSFAVAMFMKTYLPPQVIDFFVKGVAAHYRLNYTKFKISCDVSLLVIAFAMTLIFFGGIRGIGVGTLVMTALNGALIGMFLKLLDRFFDFTPIWPKLEEKLRIE